MYKLILKILMSAMIVSLNALFTPLRGHDKDNQTLSITVQETIKIEKCLPLYEMSITDIDAIEHETIVDEMSEKLEFINSINDRKEWYIAYKTLVDAYKDTIDWPETIYEWFTDEELELLFRVVQAEIGDEYSFEQKVNVASVIFNRFWHDRFPDTLSEILIASQFSVISSGRYKIVEVSEDTILACEYAFAIGDTTNGCLFFDSNSKLKYKFIFNDGAHNFYKLHDEQRR